MDQRFGGCRGGTDSANHCHSTATPLIFGVHDWLGADDADPYHYRHGYHRSDPLTQLHQAASNRSRHVERAQHPAPGGTRMDRARVVTVHGRSRGSRLQCDLRVDDTDQQHARMDLRSGRRRCATDANAPRGLLDGLRNQHGKGALPEDYWWGYATSTLVAVSRFTSA